MRARRRTTIARAITVGVSLLMLAVLSVAILASRLTQPAAVEEAAGPQVEAVTSALISCLPTDTTKATQPLSRDGVACLLGKIKFAKTNAEIMVVEKAMLQATGRDSRIETICHAVMHDFGAEIPADRVPDLIALHEYEACGSGFVHGMLTGLGKSAPSDAIMKRVFSACTAMKLQLVQAQCGHGLGHLLWNAHHDLHDTATWCNSSVDLIRVRCAAGLFMAAYYPESSAGSAAGDIADVVDDLSQMCSSMGEQRSDGCWYGFAFGLVKDQMIDIWAVPTYASMRAAQPHLTELQAHLAELGRAAFGRCQLLDEQYRSKCVPLSWTVITREIGPDRWTLVLPESWRALCSGWPEPSRGDCVAAYREPPPGAIPS